MIFFLSFFGLTRRIVWLSQCVTEASVVVSRAHWSESNPSRLAIHQASFDRPPTRHASTLTRTHHPHSKLNEHIFITSHFWPEKIRSIQNWNNWDISAWYISLHEIRFLTDWYISITFVSNLFVPTWYQTITDKF